MTESRLKLWDFSNSSIKTLHMTWFAFFLTFVMWFSHAPIKPFIMKAFDMTNTQWKALLILNVALTIPARIIIGMLVDKFGRKKTLSILICGLAVGYFILSGIDSAWAIPLAVAAVMMCSFFVQAGKGAVFAMVPLVKRRMTGQITGMVGAYGNVGAVAFLTVYSFVDASTFFLVIGGAAIICLGLVQFLDEPKGHIHEVLPDGTVQLIEVG